MDDVLRGVCKSLSHHILTSVNFVTTNNSGNYYGTSVDAVASVQKQMTQAFQIYQLRANVQHSGQKVYFDENEVSVRLGFSPGVASKPDAVPAPTAVSGT